MDTKIKSAFINFQDLLVVVTKSLVNGYINTTHHGTGIALADIETVDQLVEAREKAEKDQLDYFESESGQAFLRFQEDNAVETYPDFDAAGEFGVFGEGCYEDPAEFLKLIKG